MNCLRYIVIVLAAITVAGCGDRAATPAIQATTFAGLAGERERVAKKLPADEAKEFRHAFDMLMLATVMEEASLPKDQRDAFLLKRFNGKSPQDIVASYAKAENAFEGREKEKSL